MKTYNWLLLLAAGSAMVLHCSGGLGSSTNLPPSVSIVFPPDGVHIRWLAPVEVRVKAFDSDGAITQVQFFVDGNLIATNTNPPYTNIWPGSPFAGPGTHVLTAVAIDDQGAVTTSEPIVVGRGQDPGHNSYGIISPLGGSVFVEPATFEIRAEMGLSDGRYRPTDFYLSDNPFDPGTNRIGQVEDAPYAFTVSNLMAGTYSLFVVANTNGIYYQQPINAQPAIITVIKLAMVQPVLLSAELFEFHVLTGLPGRQNVIQGSTNLLDWIPISTNVPATNVFRFIDTQTANYSRRFYRVMAPQ